MSVGFFSRRHLLRRLFPPLLLSAVLRSELFVHVDGLVRGPPLEVYIHLRRLSTPAGQLIAAYVRLTSVLCGPLKHSRVQVQERVFSEGFHTVRNWEERCLARLSTQRPQASLHLPAALRPLGSGAGEGAGATGRESGRRGLWVAGRAGARSVGARALEISAACFGPLPDGRGLGLGWRARGGGCGWVRVLGTWLQARHSRKLARFTGTKKSSLGHRLDI